MLGPASFQSVSRTVEVSAEMAVDRQKSQEGSGVLCVKVITDGPTRVLQITDVTQQVCCIQMALMNVLHTPSLYIIGAVMYNKVVPTRTAFVCSTDGPNVRLD